MQRVLKWTARIALGIGVTCLMLFLACLTAPGQRMALHVAAFAASSSSQKLDFGELEGSLLSQGRISRIAVSDGKGVWLELRDLSFSWSPVALLTNKLQIKKLSIADVAIDRAPIDSAAAQSSSPPAWPGIALAVKDFSITRLHLGASLAGTPSDFKVDGTFDLVDAKNGLSARTEITQFGPRASHARAQLDFTPKTRNLAVAIRISEPQDGIIAHLLDLPKDRALSMTFDGNGPIDGWRATWAANSNAQPFVRGDMRVDAAGNESILQARAEGFIATLLPASTADLFSGKTIASAKFAVSKELNVELLAASLTSDTTNANAEGRLDLATLNGHGQLSVEVARPDGAEIAFGPHGAKPTTFRKLSATASVDSNTKMRPVNLTAAISGLATDAFSAEAINATTTGSAANIKSISDFKLSGIHLAASATGLDSSNPQLADVLKPRLDVDFRGDYGPDRFDVSRLEVATDAVRITSQGRIEGGRLNGTLHLASTALERLTSVLGEKITGSAQLQSEVDAAFDTGAFAVSVTGDISAATRAETHAGRLLAGKTLISGTVSRSDAGTLTAKAVRISNAQIEIAADAAVDTRSTEADVLVTIPDLSRLDGKLSGKTTLAIAARGHGDDVKTTLKLTAPDVDVAGRRLQNASIDVTTQGTQQAQVGKMNLAGHFAGEPISGTGTVDVDLAGSFGLENFKFSLASAELAGQVRKEANGALTGAANVSIPRLKTFSKLAGRSLSGRVSGRAALETGAAPFTLDLRGDDIVVDGTKIKLAKLTGGETPEGQTAIRGLVVAEARKLEFGANLQANAGGYDVDLKTARLTAANLDLALATPATIKIADASVSIAPLVIAADGGSLTISGTANQGQLDITAAINKLPASLVGAIDPTLGLAGRINGKFVVRGSPQAPDAKGDVSWTGASAAVLSDQGLPPVDVSAKAHLFGEQAAADVVITGADGLRVTISGDVPLAPAKTMALKVAGNVPMSLANRALAERGTRASGKIVLAGRVSGTLVKPDIDARLSVENGAVADPQTGMKLNAIVSTVRITSDRVSIDKLSGSSAAGGTFNANGNISLDDPKSPTAALRVALSGLKFDDHQTVSGEVDGTLSVDGPLSGPSAAGTIAIKRLDVTVPNQLPKSITDLKIKHVNVPASLSDKIQIAKEQDVPEPSIRIPLRVRLDAANRIFIKGRGLDAQLGGSLILNGTSAAPVADGDFVMARGRLSILGRQLDFKRGKITFAGSLEPTLDMEASAPADGITVTVLVTGPASKPVFKFTSVPSLPEDEVVARLLFNKSLAKLAPLQLVQLASEVDKIGGLSSGPSTLDQLKRSVGIDVLDVSTDENGGTNVSAGSFVDDKTYVGVKQGTTGKSSRVVIDHDLTKSIKARGELGADGQSKVGIGVEWDY